MGKRLSIGSLPESAFFESAYRHTDSNPNQVCTVHPLGSQIGASQDVEYDHCDRGHAEQERDALGRWGFHGVDPERQHVEERVAVPERKPQGVRRERVSEPAGSVRRDRLRGERCFDRVGSERREDHRPDQKQKIASLGERRLDDSPDEADQRDVRKEVHDALVQEEGEQPRGNGIVEEEIERDAGNGGSEVDGRQLLREEDEADSEDDFVGDRGVAVPEVFRILSDSGRIEFRERRLRLFAAHEFPNRWSSGKGLGASISLNLRSCFPRHSDTSLQHPLMNPAVLVS